MSLLKQLAGQTVIYGLSKILPQILHFVVFTIYITRRFPDQFDFAVYLELYAYATIILVIMTFRMETAFFRFGVEKEDRNRAFGSAFLPLIVVVFLCSALLYFNAQAFADLINYSHKPYYIKWFALILGFDALVALPYARMRLENRAKTFLVYRLINIIVNVAVVIFCLELLPGISESVSWLSYDPENRIDYVFFANLISSGLILLLMIKEFFKFSISFDLGLWKKMLWYSLPLIIVGIAGNINQSFAVPIQKVFLGEGYEDNMTNAGIYGAAAKMALLLNLFTTAFNYAAEPFFFNNAGHKDARKIYGQVALAFTLVAGIFVLGISAYSDILIIILGSTYREAINVVPYLLMAYLFLGLYYNFSIWYKLDDKTYWGAIISVIGAVITLAVSIYFLPRVGYIGSAYAALACYGVMAVLGFITGKVYYPIDYPIGKIVFYILEVVGLVMLVVFLNGLLDNRVLLFVVKALVILGFVGQVWVLDGRRMVRK
jgi:O-antigen/teichoic acid export membrane protein